MDRRAFVTMMGGGILKAQVAADAQQAAKIPTIGCISPGPLAPRMFQWDAFRQTLRELGYVEGQNVRLEFRRPSDGLPRVACAGDGSLHQDREGEGTATLAQAGGRSEERRVGKECRSRWSP